MTFLEYTEIRRGNASFAGVRALFLCGATQTVQLIRILQSEIIANTWSNPIALLLLLIYSNCSHFPQVVIFFPQECLCHIMQIEEKIILKNFICFIIIISSVILCVFFCFSHHIRRLQLALGIQLSRISTACRTWNTHAHQSNMHINR